MNRDFEQQNTGFGGDKNVLLGTGRCNDGLNHRGLRVLG